MRERAHNKKIVLGITGSFGSGKSTVAGIFQSFGARLIDADELAHRVIRRGSHAYKKIRKIFGRGVLKKNKTIDRERLAGIVFNNINLLKRLNNIIHPQVVRNIRSQIKISNSRIIILDAPLLLEAGLEKLVDKLIIVNITQDRQVQRIQKKTHLSKADILKRIRYQIPLRKKIHMADFVIDNNRTVAETKKQVEQIMLQLRSALRLEAS